MSWTSFIDFWIMRELGQEDAIFRNYDLLRYSGNGQGQLYAAMKQLGMDMTRIQKWEYADNFVPEVAQNIANMYCLTTRPDPAQVRIRLIAWYTWDRIRRGVVTQWFLSEMVKGKRR